MLCRLYSCGQHKCTLVCHSGECGDCPFSPEKVSSCPCGKIPLVLLSSNVRKKCTDEIPVCPNTCEKLLKCGIHTCRRTCHVGPCGDCQEEVTYFKTSLMPQIKVFCRCKSSSKKVKCYLSQTEEKFQCNKVCKGYFVPSVLTSIAMRSCQRHKCGKICCSSSPSGTSFLTHIDLPS